MSDDKRYKNESEMDSDMNEEPQTTRYKPDADDEYSGKKSIWESLHSLPLQMRSRENVLHKSSTLDEAKIKGENIWPPEQAASKPFMHLGWPKFMPGY